MYITVVIIKSFKPYFQVKCGRLCCYQFVTRMRVSKLKTLESRYISIIHLYKKCAKNLTFG